MVKRMIAVAFCVFALGAGSALAGERNGQGLTTGAPANAGSICAFSGLDDRISAPGQTVVVAPVIPGVTQTPFPGAQRGPDDVPCKGYASDK